jgi:CheY-like chemotaxis protein
MARVLILEDEDVLRTSMARGLRKLQSLEVVEAGTMAEAVRSLEGSPPDLVFSDIDLPDRTGIEILGELGKRGLRPPIVFISAFLKAYGPQIPRHADVEVLTKPVSIEQLRELARRRLPGAAATAQAAPFSFVDYVQLACMGKHSVQVELLRGARRAGLLRVVAGEPWSAEMDGATGREAFRRMVVDRECTVQCGALRGAPGTRDLDAGGEALLLDTAREVDEAAREASPSAGKAPPAAPPAQPRAARSGPPAPAPAAAPAAARPSSPEESQRFDELWDEALTALLSKELERALALFREAARLRPGDKRVEANLARLRDLGVGGPEGAGGGT